eukprot:gene5130-7146_t
MKPIGMRIRLTDIEQKKISTNNDSITTIKSIEDRIKELENNIESEIDSDYSDAEDDKISQYQPLTGNDGDKPLKIERDANGNIIRMISVLSEKESIDKLPKQYLPTILRKNNGSYLDNDNPRPSKIRFIDKISLNNDLKIDDGKIIPKKSSLKQSNPKSGLEQTVLEMLKNYEPQSYEKRPFYCRICKYQGTNTDELMNHRETENHKIAIEIEKKFCFCKTCKKQFTSPEQIKEHLKGKWHQEKLARFKRNNTISS